MMTVLSYTHDGQDQQAAVTVRGVRAVYYAGRDRNIAIIATSAFACVSGCVKESCPVHS